MPPPPPSCSALVPEAEFKGDMGQTQPGSLARMMNLGLRKLSGSAGSSRCTIIFINQLRYKVQAGGIVGWR